MGSGAGPGAGQGSQHRGQTTEWSDSPSGLTPMLAPMLASRVRPGRPRRWKAGTWSPCGCGFDNPVALEPWFAGKGKGIHTERKPLEKQRDPGTWKKSKVKRKGRGIYESGKDGESYKKEEKEELKTD